MSGEAEKALSDVSTAESVFRGAAEAPGEAGARATDGEVASRSSAAQNVARLAAVSGPVAQEEARIRAVRRTHLWSILKERTAGIPELSLVVAELEAIEQVHCLLFSMIPPSLLGWP